MVKSWELEGRGNERPRKLRYNVYVLEFYQDYGMGRRRVKKEHEAPGIICRTTKLKICYSMLCGEVTGTRGKGKCQRKPRYNVYVLENYQDYGSRRCPVKE